MTGDAMTGPTRGERLYRALLRLYPPAFRRGFGDEMTELMRDRLRAAKRAGGGATWRLWLRVAVDLAISAPAERWHELRRGPGPTGASHPFLERTREPLMHALLHDLRHAARGLLRQPAIAVTVIAVLGLGIGATGVLFGLVDAVLIRPLPFEAPDRLVTIWNRYGTSVVVNAAPDFVDRVRASTLESVAATFSTAQALRLGAEQPEQIIASFATSTLFPVLGVTPMLGHASFPAFDSGDDHRRVVISHALWQRRFGGESGVLGRDVLLDGEAHEITAVMPRHFDYPRGTDVWLPLTFTPEQLADDARGNEYLSIVARLGEGVALESARSEMDTIAAAVIANVPDRSEFLRDNGWGAEVVPLRTELVGDVRPALLILFVAVSAVLLLACANVANLLLVRTLERRRDLGVRLALGADRRRLWSLKMAESGLLAVAGSAVGILVAWVALTVLPRVAPYDLPGIERAGLDPRVIAFVVLVTAVVTLVSGSLPAWRAGKLATRGMARTLGHRSDRRIQRGLVVYEIASATVLLVAAGLLLRSFVALAAVDPGFDPADRLGFRVSLPADAYADRASRQGIQVTLLERLRAIPGVEGAALGSRLPITERTSTGSFDIEGHAPAPGERDPGGDISVASDGYFESLGIPVLTGRAFERGDTAEVEKVVVVDRWLADRFWPGGDAVGGRVNFDDSDDPDWRRVVGVVGHVKTNALDETGRFQVYLPASQSGIRHLHVVLWATGARAESLVPAARQAVFEVDPSLPVYDVRTLEDQVAGSIALPRWNARLLGAFALVALGLAAFGLYGLLAYTVSGRQAEIGVRMALGASARQIVRGIVGDGLRLALIGLALGVVGALVVSRLLAELLFAVTATSPATYLWVAVTLGMVAVVSCLGPARRAARLDPVTALREE